MAAVLRLNNILFNRNVLTNATKSLRLISTSQKNKETATINVSSAPSATKQEASAVAEDKNWVSYGFDFRDKANDRSAMKSSYFFAVTMCLVWGTFIWSYVPDPQLRDWAQREGYLVLREREAAGLEPISKDYIDVNSIALPSDEDLADTEIII